MFHLILAYHFAITACMGDLIDFFCPKLVKGNIDLAAASQHHLTPELISSLFDSAELSENEKAIKWTSEIGTEINNLSIDPDCTRNVSEIIRSHGYPVEFHEVTTEDGYILGLHRISPVFNQSATRKESRVALLQHGLLGQSGNWVENYPTQSLGYFLADNGFDVWMGNSRGSTYSTKHKYLDTNSMKFWHFSFDEMAKYDLPATIKHVLNKTGQAKLWYIGHSQGTLIGFAAFSKNKNLAQKIKGFVALAPVANVKFIEHRGMRCLSEYSKTINFFRLLFHLKSFQPSTGGETYFRRMVCSNKNLFWMCKQEVKQWIHRHGALHTNVSRIPVFMCHNPAGTSFLNMLHWSQLVETGVLQMYDYGPQQNLEIYNSTAPPKYNLEKLKTPVWLFTGGQDRLADPRDVDLLTKLLKKSGKLKGVTKIPTYDHYDFIFANDLKQNVFETILEQTNTNP